MRVLDLGANVGFVSVFLLTRFPECQVVAVEPDPDNAAICRRNLGPFGDRAHLVEGAVWARETRVTLAAEHRGTWASSVAVDDHGTIEGHTIAGFLGLLDGGADIVKIDIEGAEEAIFKSEDTGWIDQVRCIALEPENQPSLKAFERAIEGRMRIVHRYGDVVFAARAE